MLSALVLPGDIPGLLRRGSPVVVTDPDGCQSDGTAVMLTDGPWVTIDPVGGEQAPRTVWIPGWVGASVALDLTDATGRAHAAWWLWMHAPLKPGERPKDAEDAYGMAAFEVAPARAALVGFVGGGPVWRTWQATRFAHNDLVCPALAGLNHADPRLLPDGTRWLDAEALRLVCLHVAGRAS